MDYKPLTAQEHEKVVKELETFYTQVQLLTDAKEEYENNMLHLRAERIRKGESFLTIAKSIAKCKINISSIDALIESIRPATPQGEIVCHSCEAKGMALFEKNYKNSDADLYKCQVCNAKYVKDELLDFF
jgi:hypothetical protein